MAKPASTSPSATRPTEARHSASRTRITNNCASPVRDAVAALPTASRASAQAVRIPTSHRGQGRPPPCKSAPACAELPPADDARKCALGLRHHPQQSPQPHAEQSGLLVALAQIAHGLAGLGGMHPGIKPGGRAKILQQADGTGQHGGQQQARAKPGGHLGAIHPAAPHSVNAAC
jgi:hypothetical protein